MNKTFSYLEAQYSKNLKEFRETELQRVAEEYESNMLDTIEEMEKKYEEKLREQEDKYLAQVMASFACCLIFFLCETGSILIRIIHTS